MNTNMIKNVAFYTIWALIGAGVGALIANKILEPYDPEGEDTELDSKTIYATDQPEQVDYEEVKSLNEKDLVSKSKDPVVTVDYSKFARHTQEKQDISSVVKAHLGEEAVLSEEKLASDDLTKPYVISLDEYAMGKRDHISLVFYAEDGVVADGNEDKVKDVEKILGPDALNQFGLQSDDGDVVYIRNTPLGIDYEIVRLHKSYAKTNIGMTPPNSDKKPKNKPKGKQIGRKEKLDNDDDSEENEL